MGQAKQRGTRPERVSAAIEREIEQIDIAKVKREDFEIVTYLQETHPDLYRSLKRAVSERNQTQAQEAA